MSDTTQGNHCFQCEEYELNIRRLEAENASLRRKNELLCQTVEHGNVERAKLRAALEAKIPYMGEDVQLVLFRSEYKKLKAENSKLLDTLRQIRDMPHEHASQTVRRIANTAINASPIDQTILHDPTNPDQYGNCFQAAIASIFELPLDEVPHFIDHGNESWFSDFQNWCKERGFLAATECICEAAIRSPRGVMHSVVVHGGKVIHDPHPSKANLGDSVDRCKSITVFVSTDPASI